MNSEWALSKPKIKMVYILQRNQTSFNEDELESVYFLGCHRLLFGNINQIWTLCAQTKQSHNSESKLISPQNYHISTHRDR